MARLHSAKCPNCGAGIAVDPGAPSVICRYCQNLIVIEKRAPPPNALPFGMPGGVPSRTLYIDPKAVRRASTAFTAVILITMLLPVLIPLGIVVGGPLYRSLKGSVRPFPASCGMNETLELSGDFDGPGPAITSVGVNCKVTISKSKIKAASLVDRSAVNFELTIVDSTIETTGPLLKAGTSTKLWVKGGSLKSSGPVVDTSDGSLEVELDGATIESTSDTAIKSPSLTLEAKNATVRGKKSALQIENGAKVNAKATIFEAVGSALVFKTNPKIELTGGDVISKSGWAIDGELNMDLTVAGTKVEGATGAVSASRGNLRFEASDKARFIAADGDAFAVGNGAKLSFTDATVDAGRRAIAFDTNSALKLGPGARLSGKRGGVSAESLELDANGAVIDGGLGAGVEVRRPAKITMRKGTVKGTPALLLPTKPTKLELEGTQITGAQSLR